MIGLLIVYKCLMPPSTTFQLYIVMASIIDGGN
jgi:hypothetical protein